MSSFLNNIWHMAGWSPDFGEALVSRRIAGRRLLIFRTSEGTVAAMDDRCPHRFAPLSLGERDGDTITCGYHGLRFNAGGQCVANPYSERIPAAATVRTYPVEERDGIVWVWTGKAEAADPGGIPDFSCLGESDTRRTVRGYTGLEANYEFGTDNLMDLSHIEFVHKGSFAGRGVIFAGRHTAEQNGEDLESNWWMPGVAAPPHTQGIYPPDMITDHWLDMRWSAPASMYLQIGATPHGGPRETGIVAHQAHILTPETEGSTHYFWASTRDHEVVNPGLDAMLTSLFTQAFDDEDKPMIKAAYENLEGRDFWDQKPISLGIDAGGARARRLLQTLRSREQETAGIAAE